MQEFEEMRLARVIDAAKGVDGRVKLQKIVYLLKAMGYDLPFDDFLIRQLGPFSRAVACAADLLDGSGVVDVEEKEIRGSRDGDPIHQYNYQVRDKFKDLIKEHFDITTPAGRPAIEEMAPRLRGYTRAVLEVAATRVYLRDELGLRDDDLDRELQRLKGHLSSNFDEADKLLEELQLA